MANKITIISGILLSLILLGSIKFAGPDLLLPAVFMIVTVFVGGLCIHVVTGILKRREEVVKDWEARHQE
ncbi:hypothetical protein [Luteithermobacter gelatinilyticus]|uniref:hypothetical protein n=1 Tax=Luteithermobacter gelatinilyticus TaxID=2582913 RepID=UPI001106D6D8|nr:hypothetical protein [Luteithermobacter gelatinilyticus]|tara:strand:+ start:5648 stop:5857 length:210 start_codon:yes stop_codon:yes gene_type:complete